MEPLGLHSVHEELGGRFGEISGTEVVLDYGDPATELDALEQSAGIADLSFRGRLCLAGSDRMRFLHGQVTNDIKRLASGEGCYAFLTNAKGRIEADLNVYNLGEECLLDFEPGLADAIASRLEKYIIADDVRVVGVASAYGLIAIEGPRAGELLAGLETITVPQKDYQIARSQHEVYGELYVAACPHFGIPGFDIFAPTNSLADLFRTLAARSLEFGGSPVGWRALNEKRILQGIPRFGEDMDAKTLPQETGLEDRAVSFKKGCYIGQEVISRIRTYGQVTRTLRQLRLRSVPSVRPNAGEKLWLGDKEVGQITSVCSLRRDGPVLGIGYVRKEANAPGTILRVRNSAEAVEVELSR